MSASIVNTQVEQLARQKVMFKGVSVIPENIRQLLEGDFQNQECLDHLLRDSEVCRILRKDPASFLMLNFAYFGKFLNGAKPSGLDWWLRSRSSGEALKSRLYHVSKLTAEWLSRHPLASVVDFGAGPGEYGFKTMELLPNNYPWREQPWRCIELDELANAYGRERLQRDGFSGMKFELNNFMSRDSYPRQEEAADFGLLIGVLCGMPCETAVKCLEKIKPHFKPGAEMIAATLLTKAFEEDAQSFRIYCNVLNWQLRPKTISEVNEVFGAAGWEIINISSERSEGDGQYAVVHCRLT